LFGLARFFGLQCCGRWNRLWFGCPAVREVVCGVWEEVQTRLHYLSFPTGMSTDESR